MTQFYAILFRESDRFGVAYGPEDPPMEYLPEKGIVKAWRPFVLRVKNGDYSDYLANDMGFRLCSEKLKSTLQENASPLDAIQWLDVLVTKQRETRDYFILHFPSPADALDRNKTIFSGDNRDFVVKPVLSRSAAERHRVFTGLGCGQIRLFVAEGVKSVIKAQRCTGIEFSKLPVN